MVTRGKRPNIIFVLTDDQGYWALGANGNEEIQTPQLDALAAEGILFSNFFCASPVCSPARASILTGKTPSQHGVHDWIRDGNTGNNALEYLQGQHSYVEILADSGYHCGIVGKWHLGNSLQPQHGFSHWFVHKEGGGPYYGAEMVREGELYTEERYITDVITDEALAFIEEWGRKEQPFYLSVNYTAPHSPWDREQHPQELFALYEDCPFASCPDLPMHPQQINSAPWGTKEKRHELLSGYYAAITAVDRSLARIVEKLNQIGVREDTLLIFTSDNGMNMGHHGIYGKGNGTFPQNMFDTSIKVPMIITGPGNILTGQRCDSLLSHYDLMPTILDYLGLAAEIPRDLPGRSFASLLRGEGFAEPETVVVYDEYGPVRMIRTKEWKYVHRYPYGPHELFNLKEDPEENQNRIGHRECQELAASLRYRLEEWFLQYADPRIDGTREAVTGRGQLGPAGLKGRGRRTYADDFEFLSKG